MMMRRARTPHQVGDGLGSVTDATQLPPSLHGIAELLIELGYHAAGV